MNDAISRIGPSRLVVTVASAVSRNPSGDVQSSGRMMPAIAMTTLSEGCSARTVCAAVRMLSASVVSI